MKIWKFQAEAAKSSGTGSLMLCEHIEEDTEIYVSNKNYSVKFSIKRKAGKNLFFLEIVNANDVAIYRTLVSSCFLCLFSFFLTVKTLFEVFLNP